MLVGKHSEKIPGVTTDLSSLYCVGDDVQDRKYNEDNMH